MEYKPKLKEVKANNEIIYRWDDNAKPIAQGSSGTQIMEGYESKNPSNKVTIRVIAKNQINADQALWKRMKNQIASQEAISKLDNPYLMKTLGYAESANNIYIITQYYLEGIFS